MSAQRALRTEDFAVQLMSARLKRAIAQSSNLYRAPGLLKLDRRASASRLLAKKNWRSPIGPEPEGIFKPYTCEVFERSFAWIERHNIFPVGKMGSGDYDRATISFTAVG